MTNPRTIPAGLFQHIVRVLQAAADFRCPRCHAGPFGFSSDASEILPDLAVRQKALAPANQPSHGPRGESATARHKRILLEVRERDGGCTAKGFLGVRCLGALETDHQWGRGKGEETVENQRQLCGRHHRLKTDSHPTRIAWLENFKGHAFRHGYYDEVAKTERAIALETAQHPEHRGIANG